MQIYMYVHTRERDSRPGFDGVKIKLLLLLSRDYRLAPHWQIGFLQIARKPSFETRRGQDEVKTPQDASEKSNMFEPQDSLKAR